ncbi:kinase-like protein [Panus rudis PR-1116 ss-1]|nr:kinase-like protein [Panus rudis PR-1116 ss-1]
MLRKKDVIKPVLNDNGEPWSLLVDELDSISSYSITRKDSSEICIEKAEAGDGTDIAAKVIRELQMFKELYQYHSGPIKGFHSDVAALKQLKSRIQEVEEQMERVERSHSPFQVENANCTVNTPTLYYLQDVRIDTGAELGLGGYADVYPAQYRGARVALKRLRISESTDMSMALKVFHREAGIWQKLQHPNILPLLGIYRKTETSFPCMVSPLLQKGNIHKVMSAAGQHIPYERWIAETAHGLTYLHSQDIIHGDLRGANILIDDNLGIRLADFGLACFIHPSNASLGLRDSVAVRWAAPELLSPDMDMIKPSFESDIYSFGSVCVEIYTHQVPYADCTKDYQVIIRVQRGTRPILQPNGKTGKAMPDALWNVVQRCWCNQPSSRPRAMELVSVLDQYHWLHRQSVP